MLLHTSDDSIHATYIFITATLPINSPIFINLVKRSINCTSIIIKAANYRIESYSINIETRQGLDRNSQAGQRLKTNHRISSLLFALLCERKAQGITLGRS